MIKIINANDQSQLDSVLKRSQLNDKNLIDSVQKIVDNVANMGDSELFNYISKFDGVDLTPDNLLVSEAEIDAAYKAVDKDLLAALRRAKSNILDYHERQLCDFNTNITQLNGNKLGWIYRPIKLVGLYIPGGKASYPSSILMCAIPAIAAGVKEIVVATPNPSNPLTLVAARECGIKRIYKMGGAHAIAAMAHGTHSVDKVDLIAGPGNVYVTLAKKAVYGHVAIDMIAGPSEILIIADNTAKANYVAADMLSQAEHDEMAASILVTNDKALAIEVQQELETQLSSLNREDIARKSIENNGAIIIVNDMAEAIAISDKIAPEHLELCAADADKLAMRISNAGAVFVGNYSPEPLGDYYAGASHCLPTSGSARYFSVLNVGTFMKKISYIEYTKDNLINASSDIIAIAECESLTAHANAIKERLKQ